MKIGFTGTRQGCTKEQRLTLKTILLQHADSTEFHHGAAIGADGEFAITVRRLLPRADIKAHPSNITDQVGYAALECSDEVFQPLPPLKRNERIVEACDLLIACPAGMAEELRSGTWATIRRARRAGKPIVFCWPDGTTTREEPHS